MRKEAQHDMADELHTIRFKREGVEFELTGSPEEVARAWASLESAVVSSFAYTTPSDDAETLENDGRGDGNGDGKPKKRRRRAASQGRSTVTNSERADAEKKLAETPLDGCAQLGNKPSARIAGYAALDWAHKKAGVDGLTSQEIQKFLSSRLRIKNTYQAYASAFGARVKAGEIDRVGKIYKLMAKGEDALADHVKQVAEAESTG